VTAHVAEKHLAFPQLLDNDREYWNALGNQYWPAIYLVDRCGAIRERAFGEVHIGDARGSRLEELIEQMLTAPKENCPSS
jgi:hypothetical protein